MSTNMEQISTLIQENIKNDIIRFLPRIANRKLSIHELESIFFNHGNGHKLFMAEHNDEETWVKLPQKEKNTWNTKAKKNKIEEESEISCKAKKKDGSDCTTKAKENGLCGKHKDFAKSSEIAKKLESKKKAKEVAKVETVEPVVPKTKPVKVKTEEIKMKSKKIEGVIYLVDEQNKVFDKKTKELLGIYNPETKKIEKNDDFFDNSSMDEAEEEVNASGSEIVDSDNE